MMSACVFCDIIAGTAPASVVTRDERLIAFLDIRPAHPGHLLVVPLHHRGAIADLDDETVGAMLVLGRRLGQALRASLGSAGVNYFLADGAAAGQEIFHAHLHVIPRDEGDGFQITAAWSAPERAELDRLAARIRARLDR